MTVLFADIRDFTAFSESRPAEEVVALLNAYFAAVVPAIEAEGGVLDKYIGDGIMALFGMFDHQPDHALRAVRTAIMMAKQVSDQRRTWTALKFDGMKIGIGLQTGKAIVGAVGCPGRVDFTAIGETVNLASRIESATKDVHTTVLIGAGTRDALTPAERQSLGVAESSETVSLKGSSGPAKVYRIQTKACSKVMEPVLVAESQS